MKPRNGYIIKYQRQQIKNKQQNPNKNQKQKNIHMKKQEVMR